MRRPREHRRSHAPRRRRSGARCATARAVAQPLPPPQGVLGLTRERERRGAAGRDRRHVLDHARRHRRQRGAGAAEAGARRRARRSAQGRAAGPGRRADRQLLALAALRRRKGATISGWQGSAELSSKAATCAAIGQLTGRITTMTSRASATACRARRARRPRPTSRRAGDRALSRQGGRLARSFGYARLLDPRSQRERATTPVPTPRPLADARDERLRRRPKTLPVEAGKTTVAVTRERHDPDEVSETMSDPRLRHVQCLDGRGLHRMAYWEWGDAANPRVLVCVHGLSRQGRDFDTLARRLRERYRVVCPDVVGRGRIRLARRSDAGYQIPTYVADMVTLLARLDVEQVDWVGTSMGGLIGMGLASLPRAAPDSPARAQRRRPGDRVRRRSRASAATSASRRAGRRSTRPPTTCWTISRGLRPAHARAVAGADAADAASRTASGFKPHYDPAIARAVPRRHARARRGRRRPRSGTPTTRSRCPTLLLRGADSDLLSRDDRARDDASAGRRRACTSSPASAMRRCWSRPTRSTAVREFLLGCRHEDARERPTTAPTSCAPLGDDVAADDARATARARDARRAEQRRAARARAFAEPLLAGAALDTGEDALAHADGVAAILQAIGAAPSMRAAAYLVYAADHLSKPEEVDRQGLRRVARPASSTHARKLVQMQRATRRRRGSTPAAARAADRARAQDAARVLARPARGAAAPGVAAADAALVRGQQAAVPARARARESMQVFAPLANRLGIWQIKWELEDLAFRFLEPEHYQRRRAAARREARRARAARRGGCARGSSADLRAQRHAAPRCRAGPSTSTASGRRCSGKGLDFDRVFDVRALRVIVPDVRDCYAVLAACTSCSAPSPGEFDDYIARPKAERLPVAAHRGARRRRPRRRDPDPHAGDARARRARRRRALGLQGGGRARATRGVQRGRRLRGADRRGALGGAAPAARLGARLAASDARRRDARPTARCSTTASTSSRRRPRSSSCRRRDAGRLRLRACTPTSAIAAAARKVDGAMVPLNTPLQSGQTVEITAAKEGGPSLDWLNPELGYLQSPRSKAKVRAWFNAQAQARDRRARPRGGREAAAARGQDGAQARRPGGAARLQDRRGAVRGRRQGRVLAAQHRERCCARPSRRRRRTSRSRCRPRAGRATARQGRRAGRRRRLAADRAGALLPAGAAGRDRAASSRAARASRVHRVDCSNFRADGGARARARDRRRVGRADAATSRRSTRSTSPSRRATGRACCATSPRCSRRRR